MTKHVLTYKLFESKIEDILRAAGKYKITRLPSTAHKTEKFKNMSVNSAIVDELDDIITEINLDSTWKIIEQVLIDLECDDIVFYWDYPGKLIIDFTFPDKHVSSGQSTDHKFYLEIKILETRQVTGQLNIKYSKYDAFGIDTVSWNIMNDYTEFKDWMAETIDIGLIKIRRYQSIHV